MTAEGMREQIQLAIDDSPVDHIVTQENANELVNHLVERLTPRDEYHTMEELYRYRMLYNAHAALGWLTQGYYVVKSKRHATEEECFGGGWFIVTAQLLSGQVSNHYKLEDWGFFQIPEVEYAPEWDGHTPEIAANRLGKFFNRRNDLVRKACSFLMGQANISRAEAKRRFYGLPMNQQGSMLEAVQIAMYMKENDGQ